MGRVFLVDEDVVVSWEEIVARSAHLANEAVARDCDGVVYGGDTCLEALCSVVASQLSDLPFSHLGTTSGFGRFSPFARPLLTGTFSGASRSGSDTLHTYTKSAIVQFSSGTTGRPRLIDVSRDALSSNLTAIAAALSITPEDRIVSWLPLYHDMGLVSAVLLAEWCNCDLILMSPSNLRSRPKLWADLVTSYGATISMSPNSGWHFLARTLNETHNLSSLRLAISGGEAVQESTVRLVSTAGLARGLSPTALTPAYGLAENCVCVSVGDPDAEPSFDSPEPALGYATNGPGRRYCRLGRPVDGVRVRAGMPHEPGPIEVSGSSLATGLPLDDEGWYDTGDLGYCDSGDIVVVGRRREMLNKSGRSLAPSLVEDVVSDALGVPPYRVAAISVWGEPTERVVVAVEQSRGGEPMLVSRLRRRVRRDFGLVVDEVLQLEKGQIPRTTSGKVQRSELRNRYNAGVLRNLKV